jgi:hypothetical protein
LTTSTSKSSAKLTLVLSLAVVLLCVVIGGCFVWWYLRDGAATVKLSAQDMLAMQNAGQKMTLRDTAAGIFNPPGRAGTGGPPVLRVRTAPDPDGIFAIVNFQVIRAGQTLVRVQPAETAGAPPTLVFRQRTWGLLQDAPSFTIARRIVHEEALAHQLAVTADQLTSLAKIVSTPPLKGTYLTALPVSDSDMAVAAKAWTDYLAANASTDAAKKNQATADLLKSARDIGSAALTKARTEYGDADNAINQVLNAQQIQAYREGKTLTPP